MRSRVAALAAAVALACAGCATMLGGDQLQQMSRQSGGQLLTVRRADFPSGDPREGTRGAPGSQMLSTAVRLNEAVASVVAAHGIPDAIAVAPPYAHELQLVYLRESRLYEIAPQGFWITRYVVSDRALSDAELAQADPDRRAATQAEMVRALVAEHARVQTVGRALMAQLPAQGEPGASYGVLLLNATPTTVSIYGGEPSDEEKIVAWVDPAGTQRNSLQPGDRVTAINGISPRAVDATGTKLDGRPKFTITRAGASREVELVPERLPRRIAFVLIPQTAPNAAAVDGGIGVTSGFLELFPDDNVLAVAMGHEVAHITLGHVERKVTPGSVLKGIVGVGVLLPADIALPGAGQLLGGAMQGVENRFNRDQERDADRLGLHYARAAGYDPAAALTLMDTMSTRLPTSAVQQFLDIHPPYPERRRLIEQELSTFQ